MIERLLIQNFQAHHKLRVNLDPHITTIVGPSDVGKSAIIRALRWVCTNQPGGDAFVRHGARGATVKLVVDGHTITRRRRPGGEVNEYRLDSSAYRAFGRGVPDPITELLNIGDVTWQGQHDAPFWFSDTAGEVSRQLNAIVNLGIIDSTLANVARAVHRARTKLEAAEEELSTAKKEFDSLAWVPGFEAAVAVVEEAECRHAAAATQAATVATLATSAALHQRRHKAAVGAAEAGQAMVVAGRAAVAARGQATALLRLLETAWATGTEATEAVPDTAAVEAARDAAVAAVKKSNALQALLRDIKVKRTAWVKAGEALVAAKRKVPNVCPTCGVSLQATSTSRRDRR